MITEYLNPIMFTKYRYQIFSLLVSLKADKKVKISNWQQTNIFSLLSATQAVANLSK